MGRPTKYSLELSDEICAQLSDGVSLRTVCLAKDMPSKSTVFNWLRTDKDFRNQYEIAKQEAADCFADEIIEIADDGRNDWIEKQNKDGSTSKVVNSEHIQRSRLRVDARKWIASKLKPKKYGDKLSQELSGPDGGDIPFKAHVIFHKTNASPTD
ncbi:MAG: terminase small subunit protein [Chloroflexi bacterium]|nr:terminase small subunit protein [Chloroflexota bacterium]